MYMCVVVVTKHNFHANYNLTGGNAKCPSCLPKTVSSGFKCLLGMHAITNLKSFFDKSIVKLFFTNVSIIPYTFKGATSALHSKDETRERIEHENGSHTGVQSEHWKQRTTDYKITF